MKLNGTLNFFFVIALIFFVGCSQIDQNDSKNDTQIANPASEFCVENGGRLSILDLEDGQVGICEFDDGSYCEEWAFFRKECAKGELFKEPDQKEDLDFLECLNENGTLIGDQNQCLLDGTVYVNSTGESIELSECDSYYDGCNTCTITEDGSLGGCTLMLCREYSEPQCRIESPKANQGEMCGGIQGIMCADGLTCEYAGDYPDASGVCIPDNSELEGCKTFYDGCNTCTMTKDGSMACTERYCAPEQMDEPRCLDEEISDLSNPKDFCENNGGNYLEDYKECEMISEEKCREIGGDFNPCGSACRNDPDAEVCTMQCVPFCDLSNIDDLTDTNTSNDEVKFCTMEYKPVCGVDGKTYSNACMAGDVGIAYNGTCGSENAFNNSRICTREYNPVCGADGVTYSNPCVAGDMLVAYNGTCGSENAFNNSRICAREYNPVCGADGVTYSNPCVAGDMNIVHHGECNSTKEPLICTKEYDPVCGVDNTTYSNACMAGDVEIAYEGEC